MSLMRRHFCDVATRWCTPPTPANFGVAPRKYGLNCTIPADVNMSVGSSLRTGAEGRRRWPFSSKKARKLSRSSSIQAAWARCSSLRGGGSFGPGAVASWLMRVLLAARRPSIADQGGPSASSPAVSSGAVRASLADPDRRRLLLAGALGFLALGALQAMYGPAFPALVRRFDVGLDVVAQTVALHFAGSFVTIAAAGPLLARLGYRLPLTVGAAVMAGGALLVATAPGLPWLLTGAALGGLGFGMLDVALNLRVARAFAPNAAPALNVLNAMFGVGAVLGPAAVAWA